MGAAGNPKTQAHYRYKYALVQMVYFGTINIMSNGGVKNTDYELEDRNTASSGLTLFLVPQVPVQGANVIAQIGGTNSDTDTDSDDVTLTANDAAGKAVRVDQTGGTPATWTDVDDATLQATGYGTGGDIIDILGFPNPATSGLWTVLKFQRSHDWTPGASRMPIADRMDPADTNIRIRTTNEYSMTCDYVTADSANTLAGLRGQTLCLVAEARQDGGPIVEEYMMSGNAVVNEPSVSAADNGVVTFSMSGFYSKVAFFDPS